MKKSLTILLCGIMVLGITGCGNLTESNKVDKDVNSNIVDDSKKEDSSVNNVPSTTNTNNKVAKVTDALTSAVSSVESDYAVENSVRNIAEYTTKTKVAKYLAKDYTLDKFSVAKEGSSPTLINAKVIYNGETYGFHVEAKGKYNVALTFVDMCE